MLKRLALCAALMVAGGLVCPVARAEDPKPPEIFGIREVRIQIPSTGGVGFRGTEEDRIRLAIENPGVLVVVRAESLLSTYTDFKASEACKQKEAVLAVVTIVAVDGAETVFRVGKGGMRDDHGACFASPAYVRSLLALH